MRSRSCDQHFSKAAGKICLGMENWSNPSSDSIPMGNGCRTWRMELLDALLYAYRDGIRAASMNYGNAECEITEDDGGGKPPPRCGNFFVAVHGGTSTSGPANDRNLDELFGFSLTLTMRVTVPLDRVGDQQIARNINDLPSRLRQGFNSKCEQLRAYCHMNWARVVLTGQTPNSANDNLAAWSAGTVYGFTEPPRYAGMDVPRMVGGEWFASEPDAEDVGIVCEMRFKNARRMQPQTASVGVFF